MRTARIMLATAAVVIVTLAATLLSSSGPAHAQGVRIHLLHGIPSATVDVVADGEVIISGFSFGKMMDLSPLGGQTLKDVELRASGSDTVLLSVGDVALPSSGNYTLLAHLTVDDAPTITVFENDLSELPAGQGRLVVRHGAAAGPVEVRVDGAVAVDSLANGAGASALLTAGTALAEVQVIDGPPAQTTGPVRLSVDAGEVLIVYAVGGSDSGALQVLTEVEAATSVEPPREVPTGDGPLVTSKFALWQVVLGSVLLTGLATARRRRWLVRG